MPVEISDGNCKIYAVYVSVQTNLLDSNKPSNVYTVQNDDVFCRGERL